MRRANPGVTPEGWPYIGVLALTSVVFAIMEWEIMAFLALVLTYFCLNFFRDPERIAPNDPSLAVSPADGKVIKVERAPHPVTGEMRQVVCVFMNVFNVHVNRFPVAARVERIDYVPGAFVNASLDKASKDNERNVVSLTDSDGESWCMVQIAGLVARRIVCRVDQGEKLGRGERFGMIKFGSRVDLYLPDSYEPIVAIGDKAVAGETAVARKKTK